ncbi:MAG TPA: malectin domain-containing carbohydrate-binding protein [Polyangiaceae bacterium]
MSVVKAINSGGPAFTAGDSTAYVADVNFSGGSTGSTSSAIANTSDDALYQRWRQGTSFGYTVPVDNGVYDVRLQFQEPTFTQSGQRRFSVRAEGTNIATNLDLFARAGGRLRAFDLNVPVRVGDGTLNLEFVASLSNALVSAIRISKRTPLAFNAGGPAHTAPEGTSFYADTVASLTGSTQTASTTSAITGTTTPVVYQTNRNGSFTYSIPVKNGGYQATLKFAEISLTGAGQRVFDVRLEGQASIVNLDVFAAAGGSNRAHDVTVPVNVADGALTVELVSRVNRAMISALSIAPAAAGCTQPRSVALVVDQAFRAPLQVELDRLAADIGSEMSACVPFVATSSAATPQSVRASLKSLHQTSGLVGAVLVGDVPIAYGADPLPTVTDAYYERFNDNVWPDANGNGVFDAFQDLNGNGQWDSLTEPSFSEEVPSRERNIWTGRLTPPASQPLATRITQLRSYLSRNHAYRTGQKTYAQGMVYFDSWAHNELPGGEYELDPATNQANAQSFYTGAWLFTAPVSQGLSVVWNNDLNAQTSSWLTLQSQSREYAFLKVHGAEMLQQFGPSHFLDFSHYQSTPSRAAFVNLASCGNGGFASVDYLAGWVLFAGETLVVKANTQILFLTGFPAAGPAERLLAKGLRFGEIRKASFELDLATVFGDPTLRMRAPGTGPTLSVSPQEIVFPSLPMSQAVVGHVAEQFVTFTNTGSSPLTLYQQPQQTFFASRNDGAAMVEPRMLVDPADTFALPVTLGPGQSRQIRVYFTIDGPVLPGEYRWYGGFYTDSPSAPVVTVRARRQLL